MNMDTLETKAYKHFLFSSGLIVTLFISTIFLGLAIRSRSLLNEEMRLHGSSLVQAMIITRKWNANHSGVFVEKSAGVQSNSFLHDPDIYATNGKTYTLQNPAYMLREISDLSHGNDLFSFRITSDKLLNPANKPDAFEQRGLKVLEQGKHEYFEKVRSEGGCRFRYMSALLIEPSCLSCHAKQGYKVGDVRGGLDVSFDITDLEGALRQNMIVIIALSVLTTCSLLGLLYTAFRLLKKRLDMAREALNAIAHIDPLTGISNRRHVLEHFNDELARTSRNERPAACLMIDVDHFKDINDRYGHIMGDVVLKQLAVIVQETIRPYDLFGRLGGEEFLLVLPETDARGAQALAERIRRRVEGELAERSGLDAQRSVTISLGLTGLLAGDASVEDIIRRADSALYAAKAHGRNRVETA